MPDYDMSQISDKLLRETAEDIVLGQPPALDAPPARCQTPASIALQVRTVEGVLELMSQAGCHPDVERMEGAIAPHSNGYGCWFIDGVNPMGTFHLTAEEIVERILALQAGASTPDGAPQQETM